MGSREAGTGSQHLQVRQHQELRVGPVQKKFDERAKPVTGTSRGRSCRRHGGSRRRRSRGCSRAAAAAATRRNQLVVVQLHWGHGDAQPGLAQLPEKRPWSLLPGSVTAPRRARAESPPPSAWPPLLNRKPSPGCGGPPPCRAGRTGRGEASVHGRMEGRQGASFSDCLAAARRVGCTVHVAGPGAEVAWQNGRGTRGRPFPLATCDGSPCCAGLGGPPAMGGGCGSGAGQGGAWAGKRKRGVGKRALPEAAPPAERVASQKRQQSRVFFLPLPRRAQRDGGRRRVGGEVAVLPSILGPSPRAMTSGCW